MKTLAETLRETKENTWTSSEEIANMLLQFAGISDKEVYKDLEEAIYELKIYAENEHNKDYWRVLYNVLIAIVEHN